MQIASGAGPGCPTCSGCVARVVAQFADFGSVGGRHGGFEGSCWSSARCRVLVQRLTRAQRRVSRGGHDPRGQRYLDELGFDVVLIETVLDEHGGARWSATHRVRAAYSGPAQFAVSGAHSP